MNAPFTFTLLSLTKSLKKPRNAGQTPAIFGDCIMKSMVILLASFFASSAFGTVGGMRLVNDTGVLENISIVPVNGGFNPSFEALTISARVIVGGNACMAEGLSARLVAQPDFEGNHHVTAVISGSQEEGRACPLNFDPVYANVSTTVRGQQNIHATTYLHHAFERDLTVSAARFMQCNEPARCTREYDPQFCGYRDMSFRGDNFCLASLQAKTYACVKGIVFDLNELSCMSTGGIEE